MAEPTLELSEVLINEAFEFQARSFEVSSVQSVWSPTICSDIELARSTAREMLDRIERDHADLDEGTKQLLIQFGGAVGALTLRRLFNPGVSDVIEVYYREDSHLDQANAVGRVARGLRDPRRGVVLRALMD
jgi:hypothetical protein